MVSWATRNRANSRILSTLFDRTVPLTSLSVLNCLTSEKWTLYG